MISGRGFGVRMGTKWSVINAAAKIVWEKRSRAERPLPNCRFHDPQEHWTNTRVNNEAFGPPFILLICLLWIKSFVYHMIEVLLLQWKWQRCSIERENRKRRWQARWDCSKQWTISECIPRHFQVFCVGSCLQRGCQHRG
jgi:hypothetical protein